MIFKFERKNAIILWLRISAENEILFPFPTSEFFGGMDRLLKASHIYWKFSDCSDLWQTDLNAQRVLWVFAIVVFYYLLISKKTIQVEVHCPVNVPRSFPKLGNHRIIYDDTSHSCIRTIFIHAIIILRLARCLDTMILCESVRLHVDLAKWCWELTENKLKFSLRSTA